MTPPLRTVAILSPDFPPGSLPSSIRARLFASHLPEFGWRPIVITTLPEYHEYPSEPDNERLIPEGLELIRTAALPARQMRRFGIGDVGIRSLWHHWREIRRLCRSNSIDLLFITVPPNVPMILGRLAKLRFGTKYVIDYQDPWITDVYWKLPQTQRPPKWALTYALARLLEPFAIRRASHITAVSEGTIRAVLERYPDLAGLGSTTLPFGAEPADFQFLRAHPRANTCFDRTDGLIHLVYAGVCIPGMYPALRCLFGGLRSLRLRNPALAARMRLHFVGTSYAPSGGVKSVEPIAAEFGVADLVREVADRVAYLDALQLLLDASALLIIGTDEAHYTASKIYPCALSGRPIFALLHEQSSAVGSLRAISPARILTFGPGDPAEVQAEAAADHLEALVAAGATDVHIPDLTGHTARDMTRKLAQIFDSLVGEER